jgi:hypothetical protein
MRSKVASYWRGRALDIYDGRHWRASSASPDLARSRYSPQVWLNQESFGLNNRLRYTQTFFIQQDAPGAVFTGYRGVRVIAEEGSLQGVGVKEGDSYQVISAHPGHSVERLRRSRAGWAGSRYLALPGGSGGLRELARRITQGASSDFAKLERIMGYLATEGKFDPHRPGDLTSSASLEEFLFEGQPGSALDYATATVMLARASGLPARLAVGYLPGIRDPLSGAYMVRERDAHAWAEVYFEDQGWVPIDSAPRPDITLLFNTDAGVGYLFQGGFGERAFQAVKAAPGKVAETVPDLLDNQALWSGGAALFFLASLALAWRRFQGMGRRRREGWGSGLAYSYLSGEERRELLQLYRQVKKLLRRRGAEERMPWQTVGEYTALAAGDNQEAQAQLSWFADTVRRAAYNPDKLPAGLVAEGRQRLARLKGHCRRRTKDPPEAERKTN